MRVAAWIAAYVAGALLTFGWAYNAARICSLSAPYYRCDSVGNAAIKGLWWPVYWTGRGAIFITAPETWA